MKPENKTTVTVENTIKAPIEKYGSFGQSLTT